MARVAGGAARHPRRAIDARARWTTSARHRPSIAKRVAECAQADATTEARELADAMPEPMVFDHRPHVQPDPRGAERRLFAPVPYVQPGTRD